MKKKYELIEMIYETVEENLLNKNLQKSLKSEYIKKGFNINFTNLLWGNNVELDNLTVEQLIAITKVFFNELKEEKFRLTNYFSDGELFSYSLLEKENEVIQEILFKDVLKIDNKNFICRLSGKQADVLLNNNLVAYYKEFQRNSKLVKTSTGRVVKKINVNKQNLIEMKERFLKGDLTPTSIHFAIINKGLGFRNNFKFKELHSNLGDVLIKPNFDMQDKEYMPFIIADGFHRLSAFVSAYNEAKDKGIEFKSYLTCFINIFNNETSIKTFIADTFKRTDEDKSYLDTLSPTNENVYIDKFIEEANIKKHIATTKQDMNLKDMWLTRNDLINIFKNNNISMTSSVGDEIDRELIANIFKDIMEYNNHRNYNREEINRYIRFAVDNRNNNKYRTMIPSITKEEV